ELEFLYACELPEAEWTALHLPVISQLEQFLFLTSSDASPVVRQLLRYGTASLKQIIFGPLFEIEIVRRLLEFPPYLTKSVTLLELFSRDIDFRLLLAICKKYTSLESIDIHMDLLTIDQL